MEAAHLLVIISSFPPSPSPSAQVDVPCKLGDQQNDGEAGEQPCILDQEEDHLARSFLLFPRYAVHLWKLRRRKTVRFISRA